MNSTRSQAHRPNLNRIATRAARKARGFFVTPTQLRTIGRDLGVPGRRVIETLIQDTKESLHLKAKRKRRTT